MSDIVTLSITHKQFQYNEKIQGVTRFFHFCELIFMNALLISLRDIFKFSIEYFIPFNTTKIRWCYDYYIQ